MSQTGPNAFVVVGDTDWWSTQHRNVGASTDSRLLSVRNDAVTDWKTTLGNALRSATAQKQYAELLITGVIPFFGLVKEGQEATVTTLGNYPGNTVDTVGLYMGDRGIYYNAAGIATANSNTATAPATPYTLGLMCWLNASSLPVVRFVINGRRNILGRSEDFGHADWVKQNGGTATGKQLTFVNNNSLFLQAISEAGGVGSTFTFSALVSCNNSTTLQLALTDNADGVPYYSQNFSIGPTAVRCTLTATMGAGYSGTLSVRFVGNAAITAGSVVTVDECSVNAGLELDSYQRQDGAAGGYAGPPVTLTAGRYRLATSHTHAGAECTLRVDRDDLQFPQSDCQPRGAAARVSDAGGYSPAASKWDRSPSSNPATIDAYGRTATASVNGTSNNAFSATRSYSAAVTDLIYCEYEYEVLDANDTEIGLVSATKTNNVFVGGDALSWGYSRAGNLWHNNVATVGMPTYTAADYPGWVWQPSTGKVWFTKNGVALSGNPEAGTGAHYSNALGTLQPAATLWSTAAGRLRLRTHAREQRYRPTYCKACDGADILPEQHYRGRLENFPEVEQSVHYGLLWGGSKPNGATTQVRLSNADGNYDALSQWDLRNQFVAMYLAGQMEREATMVVERVTLDGEATCSVLCSSADAVLDVRIDRPLLVIGEVLRAPMIPQPGAAPLTYDICDTPFFSTGGDNASADGGLFVTSLRRIPSLTYGGIVRTVSPAKKQHVSNLRIYRKVASITVANAGFSAWTGGTPDNWTVTGSITQSGSTARIQGTATLGQQVLYQDKDYLIRLKISAYTSGSLFVENALNGGGGGGGSSRSTRIGTTGDHWVQVEWNVGTGHIASWLVIKGAAGTDLNLDEVELWEAARTGFASNVLTYVLSDLGGLASAFVPADRPPNASQVGYWSDQRPTVRAIVRQICDSWFADHYIDSNGNMKLAWAEAPEQYATSGLRYRGEIKASDVVGRVAVTDDTAAALSDRSFYARAYVEFSDTDIAGAVTDSNREALKRTASETVPSGFPYAPFYRHALGAPPMRRLAPHFFDEAMSVDYDYDMDRVHAAYTVRRRFYAVPVSAAIARAMKLVPGSIVSFVYPRFGLAAGKKLQVVGVSKSLGAVTARLRLWG